MSPSNCRVHLSVSLFLQKQRRLWAEIVVRRRNTSFIGSGDDDAIELLSAAWVGSLFGFGAPAGPLPDTGTQGHGRGQVRGLQRWSRTIATASISCSTHTAGDLALISDTLLLEE